MGTQYKISPQIEEFIVYYKKENPKTSCRKLEGVLKEKFQIKLSKSSINTIIKNAGLSEKVGRKPSKPKPELTARLYGALAQISAKTEIVVSQPPEPKAIQPEPFKPETPKPNIHKPEPVLEPQISQPEPLVLPQAEIHKTEPEITPVPVKEKQVIESGVCIYRCVDSILDGFKYVLQFLDLSAGNQDFIKDAYLKISRAVLNNTAVDDAILSEEFEKSASLICRHLPQKLEEAHFIKMTLQDNSAFYIDAEFSSFWPTINIPLELSFSVDWTKARLLDNINKNTLSLLTAPLDSSLLNSLLRLSHIGLKKAELLGDAGRVIYSFEDRITEKMDFIFGMPAEKYTKPVKITDKAGSAKLSLGPLDKELDIEDYKIELTGSPYFQEVELRMLGLIKPGSAKPFFYIITNISAAASQPQEISRGYLEYWPNPEFAIEDLDKKIELFNYDIKRQFPNYPATPTVSWDSILSFWREALQTYVSKHCLPFDYEKYPPARIKERLYELNAEIEEQAGCRLVRFILPQSYAFKNDLEYVLNRLNQKGITDIDGKRLWLKVG